MPFDVKACACGVAEADCEYHKPQPAAPGTFFGLDRSGVKLAGMNVAAAPAAKPKISSAWVQNGDNWGISDRGITYRYNVGGLPADQLEQFLLACEAQLRANGWAIPA